MATCLRTLASAASGHIIASAASFHNPARQQQAPLGGRGKMRAKDAAGNAAVVFLAPGARRRCKPGAPRLLLIAELLRLVWQHRNRRQERLRVRVVRSSDQLGGCLFLDDAPPVHHRNPIGDSLHNCQIVGNK